jgi:hypothetical protein
VPCCAGHTHHHGLACEEGASLVTSVFGVGIFLTFLLVVVQVVLFLFTASVVQAAAVDGASHGAGAAQAGRHVVAAEAHAAQVLGRLAEDAEIVPVVVSDGSGSVLAVRIRVRLPSVLGAVGLASVERAAEARIEQ